MIVTNPIASGLDYRLSHKKNKPFSPEGKVPRIKHYRKEEKVVGMQLNRRRREKQKNTQKKNKAASTENPNAEWFEGLT